MDGKQITKNQTVHVSDSGSRWALHNIGALNHADCRVHSSIDQKRVGLHLDRVGQGFHQLFARLYDIVQEVGIQADLHRRAILYAVRGQNLVRLNTLLNYHSWSCKYYCYVILISIPFIGPFHFYSACHHLSVK
jgi:hypothetical protein